jgi:hypothetical protein
MAVRAIVQSNARSYLLTTHGSPIWIDEGEAEVTPIHSLHDVGPTSGQELALRKMLRSLLGGIDFDRCCAGIKLGTIDEDVLRIFVPAGIFPIDILLRHSEDFAVAAEYVFGQPIRKVDVLSAD